MLKKIFELALKIMLAMSAIVGVLAIVRYLEGPDRDYVEIFDDGDEDFEEDFY